MSQPEIDICSKCGEHAEYEEGENGECLSSCCGASPCPTDVDIDIEGAPV